MLWASRFVTHFPDQADQDIRSYHNMRDLSLVSSISHSPKKPESCFSYKALYLCQEPTHQTKALVFNEWE